MHPFPGEKWAGKSSAYVPAPLQHCYSLLLKYLQDQGGPRQRGLKQWLK